LFNGLTALGWGLILFAIVLGIGSVVLYNLSGSLSECDRTTGFTWNTAGGNCTNVTAAKCSSWQTNWDYNVGYGNCTNITSCSDWSSGFYYNITSSNCTNGTGAEANYSWSFINSSAPWSFDNVSFKHSFAPVSDGYSNTNYLLGQLGQSGLAGWAPAIIAVTVGMFIIGALAINTGGQQGRQY